MSRIPYKRGSAEERFWRHVAKGDGCWEWTASLISKGYGQFRGVGSKRVSAHRFSWEMHNGPVPPGMFVCHRCDNPKCVRPEHLFLGTHADNMRDMLAKGRGRWTDAHPSLAERTDPWAKWRRAQLARDAAKTGAEV